jgi:hypothetical protein
MVDTESRRTDGEAQKKKERFHGEKIGPKTPDQAFRRETVSKDNRTAS